MALNNKTQRMTQCVCGRLLCVFFFQTKTQYELLRALTLQIRQKITLYSKNKIVPH